MKRILVTAILIIYSIASFGVSVNHFYCCGKLKEVSFGVEKSSNGKTAKGCCENKTVTLKLKTDQKNSGQSIFHLDAPFSPQIVNTYNYALVNVATSGRAIKFYQNTNPPSPLSRHIFFCVFII